MPSGIIMQSGSAGQTAEETKTALAKVLEEHGYETEKPEVIELVEPKREDFETEEAFAEAQTEFEAKKEEHEESETDEEREERERKEQAAAAAHPKPTRKQRAIDRATRELKEENRKLAERLAALEGKKPTAEAQPKIEAPKREAFKSDVEYEEAMFDYRYQLRRSKEAASEQQNAILARLKENLEHYQSAVADFKDEHDDWDETVNQTIPIHETVYLAMLELENGPDVTYYLGKHPDYARRLAEMSPLSAAMEVGHLSKRLKTGAPDPSAAGNGARPKPKTRLPDPVKPVSTAATSSSLSSAEAAKRRDFRSFKAAQRAGR